MPTLTNSKLESMCGHLTQSDLKNLGLDLIQIRVLIRSGWIFTNLILSENLKKKKVLTSKNTWSDYIFRLSLSYISSNSINPKSDQIDLSLNFSIPTWEALSWGFVMYSHSYCYAACFYHHAFHSLTMARTSFMLHLHCACMSCIKIIIIISILENFWIILKLKTN